MFTAPTENQVLQELFGKEMNLRMLIKLVLPNKLADTLTSLGDYCIGGAYMYGLATAQSDLDLLVHIKSAEEVNEILIKNKIENEYYKSLKPNTQKSEASYVCFQLMYFGIKIEIFAQELPTKLQRLPVHTKFLQKYFKNHPGEYEEIKVLKQKAEEGNPKGYRKSHILAFERQMQLDLGFAPERIERSELGFKYPKWKDELDPFDWIFLREVYGVSRARLLK